MTNDISDQIKIAEGLIRKYDLFRDYPALTALLENDLHQCTQETLDQATQFVSVMKVLKDYARHQEYIAMLGIKLGIPCEK